MDARGFHDKTGEGVSSGFWLSLIRRQFVLFIPYEESLYMAEGEIMVVINFSRLYRRGEAVSVSLTKDCLKRAWNRDYIRSNVVNLGDVCRSDEVPLVVD